MLGVTALLAWGVSSAEPPVEGWKSRYQTPDKWAEEVADLPPIPKDSDMFEVEVDGASGNRYFIDTAHVTVGEDGVTRLTLVTQPRRGERIITYEGIRCETHESRVYAIANGDEWAVAKQGEWRHVPTTGYKQIRGVLIAGPACDLGTPRQPEALVRYLRVPPRRVR